MANTFNAGVYREDMEVKLQEYLDGPKAWSEFCDVIFSDVKIFNIPYMSTEFSTQTGTRGTAYGFSDFTLTNETLDIATKKLAPVFVDRADAAQSPYANLVEIGVRQAGKLSDDVETAVLADHANWTDVGDQAGVPTKSDTDQITVSSTNIDDIVRKVRQFVIEGNGVDLMNRNGLAFVWRPADFEALEAFAQANGFNLADAALTNGISQGYFLMGAYHYVSNSHAANHVLAGVRNVLKVGILRTTWGQVVETQDPNLQSGFGYIARADYGVKTPTGLNALLFDINVA